MARILGVTEVHLGRLSKSGDLPEPVSRGKWDVIATVQAFIIYKIGDAKPAAGGGDAKSEELLLLQERRRKVAADADRQERENAIAKGDLIEAEFARSVFFESARRARNAWMSWPAKIAPLIAADLGLEVEPVNEVLDAHVHEHITRLGDAKCAIPAPAGDHSAAA